MGFMLGIGLGLGSRAVFTPPAPPEFPATLFQSGEGGGAYRMDANMVFTDTARTAAAVATNSVGGVTDQSGIGAHWTQSSGTGQPTLQDDSGDLYLSNDGGDSMAGAVTFPLQVPITIVARVRTTTGASSSFVNLVGVQGAITNDYMEIANRNNSGLFRALSRSSTLAKAVEGAAAQAAGALDTWHTVIAIFTEGLNSISVDGAAAVTGVNTWAAADAVANAKAQLWIGANAGSWLRAAVIINRLLDGTETADAVAWVEA